MLHIYPRRAIRRITAYLKLIKPKGLILIYHRVIDLPKDPQQLTVGLYNFEKQIEFLKKNYQVLSLQEFIADKTAKSIREKSIVITFDDGYFDNYINALPILEKYEIPATIFVSTNFIDKNEEFWWDKLEQILLSGNHLPTNLEIQFKGRMLSWNTNKIIPDTLYSEIYTALKSMNEMDRKACLDKIIQWCNISVNTRDTHRPMNETELRLLSKSPLIEIGSHSISHCVLANETEDNQKHEIVESKKRLEQRIGTPILSFSYPFGGPNDYSQLSMKLVARAGYRCGISNSQGLVFNGTDLLKIPRFLIRNWDVTEFKRILDTLFKYNEI